MHTQTRLRRTYTCICTFITCKRDNDKSVGFTEFLLKKSRLYLTIPDRNFPFATLFIFCLLGSLGYLFFFFFIFPGFLQIRKRHALPPFFLFSSFISLDNEQRPHKRLILKPNSSVLFPFSRRILFTIQNFPKYPISFLQVKTAYHFLSQFKKRVPLMFYNCCIMFCLNVIVICISESREIIK